MLVNQKYVLKRQIYQLHILQEVLPEKLAELNELRTKLTDHNFHKFINHEAKYDNKVLAILTLRETEPNQYQAFKTNYMRAIERDILDLEVEIESLSKSIDLENINFNACDWEEKLQKKIKKSLENEQTYHTYENLCNAYNNLHDKPNKFRERTIERRNEHERCLRGRHFAKTEQKQPTLNR